MGHLARWLVRLPTWFLILAALAWAAAQEDAAPADAAAADAELPVSRVALFTSGVGYFEHAGTVTGTRELELNVATEHMNDLLQSLVLQDLDGGSVRPVRYPSRDPLARILGSYSLDLSGAPSLEELLAQARGEAVRVDAAEAVSGTILGVERVPSPEDPPRSYLTLSTASGLRRIELSEIRELRFEREELREELAAALDAVARHRNAEEKAVRLRFHGDGERRVRVGYVREMPVWKTSYRLLPHQDGTADLQGWAIFDNPTDLDLEEVAVSFVAGRPVSFVTRLYEPVYVERPRVDVASAPSVVPQADAGSRAEGAAALRSAEAMVDEAAPAPPPAVAEAPAGIADAGVEAMAEGIAAGASFEYRVAEPVTILRHESAMIPIVQRTVPTTRASYYHPAQGTVHPLRSVRIVNDTGLHLAAGPVTVLGASGFEGTARLGDLPPGESRILSYAVDLDVEVRRSREDEPRGVTAVRLRDGVLQVSQRQRVRSEYRIAGGEDGVFLVIEHPRRQGYQLVRPEPAPAVTRDGYRFGVTLGDASGAAPDEQDADAVPTHLDCEAGAVCTLEVVEERTDSERLTVDAVTPDRVAFFLENVELGDDERDLLERILDRKRQIVTVDREIAERQARVSEIHREQDRIRQNMAALDRTSSLYQRYLTDLAAQEDELEAIGRELADLRDQRSDLQEELDAVIVDFGEDTP